ncbi:MAG TPA: beta-galactosidase [Chloroflexota bacterium]|nr:beta-galactosidase [Chloroflexota bacterium]
MTISPLFAGGVFPFGTHVYREPFQDQGELLADLPVLKRLGFNMIKIQESWAIDEPREGEYDFSRIERLIARAGELGLGIYLGLTMEVAPAWLWRRYPDCRLVYASGLAHDAPTHAALPADGKPGPCWDHPGARAAGERFVAELARRLGRFENIWAWNTWQEIGFWPNDGGPIGFCFCPHTLARFRAWLRERYGSLDALNAAWYTAYGDWDEVEPPRRFPAVPAFIDWRYFMDDVYLVRALEWKTRALKEHDPGRRPVFSHVATPAFGSGAEWRWARVGDFFGNSNYPAWWCFHRWDHDEAGRADRHTSALHELWDGIMLRADMTRCAAGHDRAFWGAEYQGGPISTYLHLGRTPEATDIRRWTLAGLAAGMTGISFWNHRAERAWQECNGFGLLDPLGDSTERIEEAGRIARAINAAPEVFVRGRPPRAEVALLVNEDLRHFCQGTPEQAEELLKYDVRGHYARLWRLGIAADFVDDAEVAAGALAGYKAAILPLPLALDAAYFAHLRAFVEAGGTLISEACPGRFDRFGFCPRAQMVEGAEEVFGARHRRVRLVREPDGAARWLPAERGYGEVAEAAMLAGAGPLAGTSLRAAFYLQTLQPTSAEAILYHGDGVAGVRNRCGEGWAILLGTFAGLCATAHADQASDRFIAALLAQAGVQPDRHGALLRRRRVAGSREAWFLINPTAEAVTERVDVRGYDNVHDLLGDGLVHVADGAATVSVPAANITCLLLERRDFEEEE